VASIAEPGSWDKNKAKRRLLYDELETRVP
jgi:hypothetical protein